MLKKEKRCESSHMNQDILKRYDKVKRMKKGQKEDKKMKR